MFKPLEFKPLDKICGLLRSYIVNITWQAAWRGRKVRLTVKKKKMAAIRQNLQKANSRVKCHMTLLQRNQKALQFILKYRYFRHFIAQYPSGYYLLYSPASC